MKGFGFEREKQEEFFEGKDKLPDLDAVEKMFCDEDAQQGLQENMKKRWYSILNEDIKEDVNLDHILYRIHYKINSEMNNRKKLNLESVIKWTGRVAAILILPLALYLAIQQFKPVSPEKMTWVDIKAPAWTRVQFSLPDGSTGWLNSNSSLRYSGDYLKDRTLILDGESYLDVVTDEKHPLSVITGGVVVKVLGTKFNVASYKDEENVEVVLEEGKILFSDLENKNIYTLEPNEMLTYNKTNKDLAAGKVNPQKYLAWKEGRLVFRNDPLDIVARRIGRWYNVDVEIIGEVRTDLRLRATFLDENLEEVMHLLEQSLSIDYIILDRNLISGEIYSKRKVIITQKLVETNI
ncbi:MAG: DUF4974 domain-containing protein [Bacteroidales bacterium]|jgi:ferric-dicitrate binding protein FerR (iron transport regulator)|nr:DUF4974 domain-containing protein [Bacteroidales bacterium]